MALPPRPSMPSGPIPARKPTAPPAPTAPTLGTPLTPKLPAASSAPTGRVVPPGAPNVGGSLGAIATPPPPPAAGTTGLASRVTGARPMPVRPSPPAAAPAPAAAPDTMAMYNDLIGAHDKQSETERAEIMRNSLASQGAAERRAALMNARMGRSIAGGFAGLSAQGQLGVLENERKALAEQSLRSGDKRTQLQMAYLDKQFERDLMEDQQAHDLDVVRLQQGPMPGAGPSQRTVQVWDNQKAAINDQLSPADQAAWNDLYAKWKLGEVTSSEMKAWLDDRGVEYTTRGAEDAKKKKKDQEAAMKVFEPFMGEEYEKQVAAKNYLRTGKL